MKETLQSLLHVTVKEKKIENLEQLPLYLKNGYEIKLFSLGGVDVFFIKSKEQITVTALYKHWKRFEALTGRNCVVYSNEYTRYRRERMIELGIPFYFGRYSLYLPFFGVALGKKMNRVLPEIEKFAPVTQKMLLLALYENWQKLSTREISENMGVSRATAARCLTELQALNLPLTVLRGKTKYYQYEDNAENLYGICKAYFDNPVAKSYSLAKIPKSVSCYGGMTAIEGYSMISDNDYPTFAVTREEYRKFKLNQYETQPKTERPVCVVQVLRYKIERNGLIDPISAVLCVPAEEKEDPRMADAIEKILEDVFHGEGAGNI